jgi:hypothetical protein
MNDYSIYIKNSIKDQQTKQSIVGLSEAALRGGQINFVDLIKVLNADTAKETERILQKSIEATQRANQEMQQQQMQMQQAQMQQKAQSDQEKNQILAGANAAKVEAAKVAGQAKIKAEEIEQGGKRDFEDHKFTRDLDRMVMQEDGITAPPSQAQGEQLMQIKKNMGEK